MDIRPSVRCLRKHQFDHRKLYSVHIHAVLVNLQRVFRRNSRLNQTSDFQVLPMERRRFSSSVRLTRALYSDLRLFDSRR